MTTSEALDAIRVRGGNMPSPMFRHLYPLAQRKGVSVFDLLVELARRQLADPAPAAPAPHPPKAPTRIIRAWTPDEIEALGHMNAAGLSDHAIARRLKRQPGSVALKRRTIGLPANFKSFRDGSKP